MRNPILENKVEKILYELLMENQNRNLMTQSDFQGMVNTKAYEIIKLIKESE